MKKNLFLVAALAFSGLVFAGEPEANAAATGEAHLVTRVAKAVAGAPRALWNGVTSAPGKAWDGIVATPAAVKAHPVKATVVVAAVAAAVYFGREVYKSWNEEEEDEEVSDIFSADA